jgi:hypothetical protein
MPTRKTTKQRKAPTVRDSVQEPVRCAEDDDDITCPSCDGSCEYETDDGRIKPCGNCGGTGLVPNE